ncbi:helix-turn-helix domain-containing protein [Rhodococcus pyridinivorans]
MPNIDEDAKRWQESLATRVGKAVAEWRKKRKFSAVELSERTAQLGYPISRVAISKIEQGSRAGKMDLSELLILARALQVPPALLVYPEQMDGTVEVVPGQRDSSFLAMRWFTGEGVPNAHVLPAPKKRQGSESVEELENAAYLEAAAALELPRALFLSRFHLQGVMRVLDRSDNTPEQAAQFREIAARYQADIDKILSEMRSLGLVIDDE